MEIEKFIIQSVSTMPAHPSGRVLLALVALIGFGILASVMFRSAGRNLTKGQLFDLVYQTVIGFALVVGAVLGDFEMYPERHSSHRTCHYVLRSGSMVIDHTTLVPRNDPVGCAAVGASVMRLKSPSSVMFIQEFQTPI